MEYETVIGLEVHAQILTESKMFCKCSSDYANAEPNTHVCPVCLGMPGVLPVINKKAIEYNIMTGLALNCEIPEYTKFDRKNYPYPDLMKGYQISQYDAPLCVNGSLAIDVDGQRKTVGITRVHQEEDTARLVHGADETGETYSLIDVNRAGCPLMEIVSEPDMRSPEEARQYLMKLRTVLQYLGVSTGKMEEGSFRCDANVSVRPVGTTEFGVKVEIKNMNSFRAVFRALEYEVQRQVQVLEQGGRLIQETRGWQDDKGITVGQRTKEFAHDYRYFPEPDLPPLVVSRQWAEEIKSRLPELPDAKRDRLMADYGLPLYDAGILVTTRSLANYYESTVRLYAGDSGAGSEVLQQKGKTVSNWILGEFMRLLNATGTEIEESKVSPEILAEMLKLIDNGTISGKIAKTVFEEMFNTGKVPGQIVAEKGLTSIADESQIVAIIDEVIAANPQALADYAAGKTQSFTFLIGQVMKATRGKADPALTNRLLKERLSSIPQSG